MSGKNVLILVDRSTSLAHYNIKGATWHVRRWQNYDGTLTPAGKERYYGKKVKGSNHAKDMSDEDLKNAVNRINLERNFETVARNRYATESATRAKRVSKGLDVTSKASNVASNALRVGSGVQKISGSDTKDTNDKLNMASSILSLTRNIVNSFKNIADSKAKEIDVTALRRDIEAMTDQDLWDATNRIRLEDSYNMYVDSQLSKSGYEVTSSVLSSIGNYSAYVATVIEDLGKNYVASQRTKK